MAEHENETRPGAVLAGVMRTIEERKRTMPERSYVAALLREGTDAILRKLAEETEELIRAVREEDRRRQIAELCDVFFHGLVLMAERGITLAALEAELARRRGVSGLDEKAAREPKPSHP